MLFASKHMREFCLQGEIVYRLLNAGHLVDSYKVIRLPNTEHICESDIFCWLFTLVFRS